MGVNAILSLVMKLSNHYSGLNHLNNPLQEIIKCLYSLVLVSHSKNNKIKQIESPPSLYTLSMFFSITICVIIVSNWVTKYASWEQSCLKRKCGSTVSLHKLLGNQRLTWMAFDEFHKTFTHVTGSSSGSGKIWFCFYSAGGGGGIGPACKDSSKYCPMFASQCSTNAYVRIKCKKTCRLCWTYKIGPQVSYHYKELFTWPSQEQDDKQPKFYLN